MNKKIIACLFFFIFFFSNYLFAQKTWSYTGYKFFQGLSKVDPKTPNYFYAFGYMEGIISSYSVLEPKFFCFPKKTPLIRGQIQLIILKWLKEHPDELHGSAHILIVKALMSAFPCKK